MTVQLFRSTVEMVFGDGASLELPRVLTERGFSRPLFVADAAVASQAAVRSIIESFAENTSGVFQVACGTEPSYAYLDECADAVRDKAADCLIGIGGGSAMDICKGMAVLLRNPGKGLDYRGMDKVPAPGVPTVLLPTTAGTGSEATFTAVFIDRPTHTKMGINGRHVMARLAVLDPALTGRCPHNVAVGAGLDAMVHALEAFMTAGAHPLAHLLAEDAFCRMFEAFPCAVQNPDATEARLQMLLGSHMAGLTLMYSGGGIAGALAYPLGASYGVPHGLAGGLLLEHIIRENIEGGYTGYARLHDRLFPDDQRLSAPLRSQRFLIAFQELLASIKAPRNFGGALQADDVPAVVAQTIAQRAPVLANNPVRVDDHMLRRILSGALAV